MYLNGDKKVLGKFVAVLGIIQGLTWQVLAIVCIALHHRPPNTDSSSTYREYLSDVLVNWYIKNHDDRQSESRVIESKDFYALMWVYVVISAIWIAASIDEYAAISLNKKRQIKVTLLLGILILMISTLDLIFTGLLARDFGNCVFNAPLTVEPATGTTIPPTHTTIATTAAKDTTTQIPTGPNAARLYVPNQEIGLNIDCQLATGIMMTLAARGYVLLAVNIILGIALIMAAAKVYRHVTPVVVDTFEHHSIPRVKIPKSQEPGEKQPSKNSEPYYSPSIYGNQYNRMSTPAALNNTNQNIYY